MRRAQEIGKGLVALGSMLAIVSFCLGSGRLGAGFVLVIFGWVFFMCACGAGQMPLRQIPFGAWAVIALGLVLMGMGLMWVFIYKDPWLFPLSLAALVVALVLMAVGLWVNQRATQS